VPYEIKEEGEDYLVINKDSGDVKARHTPPDAKEKAEEQVRLLHGIEHGMEPKGNHSGGGE